MRLRTLRKADLPLLSSWLPRATSDAGCDAWTEDALARSIEREGVLTTTGRDPTLVIAYETGVLAPDAARIRLLAVDPERRRLGLGGEAALALERRLAKSMGRIYVLVPSRLGIALYFWLRLGYRPLTRAEWPAPPEQPPAAWMVRDLTGKRS